MRPSPFVIAALLLVVEPGPVSAQTLDSKDAAHSAIILTPHGALPAVLRVRRDGDSLARVDADVRYGRYRFNSRSALFHNVGVSARYLWHQRLSVGATLGMRSCDGCDGTTMGSVDVATVLWRKAGQDHGDSDTDLLLRVSGGLGKADTSGISAMTLAASLPIAVSLPQTEEGLLTLFFAPGVAYGFLDDETGRVLGYADGDGATLLTASAGVGFAFRPGLGVHASVYRVIIDDSPTQFGVALSWRFGR